MMQSIYYVFLLNIINVIRSQEAAKLSTINYFNIDFNSTDNFFSSIEAG